MAKDAAYKEALRKIKEAQELNETSLDLSNMKLSELPPEIGKLTQLTNLNLYSNKLNELPPEIGKLTQLIALYLNSNKLTELPPEIGQLKTLTTLDLRNNELTEVPAVIRELTNLETLNLDHNVLGELPDWIGDFKNLRQLWIRNIDSDKLPDSIGEISQLRNLDIGWNNLSEIPGWIGKLPELRTLYLTRLRLTSLPECIGNLTKMNQLYLHENEIKELPEWIGNLRKLRYLECPGNQITDLPPVMSKLGLTSLDLNRNPLNPELKKAYEQGLDAVKAYLAAKAAGEIELNEAKLILIGEGEVGKSCLLDALQGKEWQEHPSTHGIQIEEAPVIDKKSGRELTMNCWDFGGQRVYRPTHQLFFSSPAVYLVVWKPREGPQAGAVIEWIKLILHREPDAKILVVATHGGPQQRQPDIDKQELWDLFGRERIIDFFHVESKQDGETERSGIDELKNAIAEIAVDLPEVGRKVPTKWQKARDALNANGKAYLQLLEVKDICSDQNMDENETELFITLSHRLGHLIHYENDPVLSEIVVLKPDWLATAVSYVLDDKETRDCGGLVDMERLKTLWSDPSRDEEFRYSDDLHPVFVALMEKFDISYRISGMPPEGKGSESSLIAQLVPDTRPEKRLEKEWRKYKREGDTEQVQICQIVEAEKGQSETAEGLFYQLIVRLHRFSMGRERFEDSVHWKRGLVLDGEYNGRALLEHTGNDVHITVRAPYPEGFLTALTTEVKWLVDNFWKGLRCDVMVPCIEPCGKGEPGSGLYEVSKLIESKRKSRPEYPCPDCNEWQDIDSLLRNAPAARPYSFRDLVLDTEVFLPILEPLRKQMAQFEGRTMGRFDNVDASQQEVLSKVESGFQGLLKAYADEAKEGPRLFSFVPVERSRFNPKGWTKEKFRLTLWCEHSQLPMPELWDDGSRRGEYDIELTREWFVKATPLLKVLTGTLSLALPVASSGVKLALDGVAYKAISEQLVFGKKCVEASLKGGAIARDWMEGDESPSFERGVTRAEGGMLRELQAMLKEKDPSFGGMIRAMNKRREFVWVHPRFAKEY